MSFDVIVIGGGPGGYVAAIRASQLGYTTACIDGYMRNDKYSLGGTCLNVGCIPSKALLQSSENYAELLHKFSDHGITCTNPAIDITKMLARKNNIIDKNANGITFLFKKNKVTEIHGWASFHSHVDGKWLISVDNQGKIEQFSATHIIVATGSTPRTLPNIKIDNKNILDNTGALDLNTAPNNLCIIGAGVIGLELGSVWQRLGSKVVILEAMDKFLSAADEQIAKELFKNLTQQGLSIHTAVKIDTITEHEKQITVNYMMDNKAQQLVCDKLIVAVGRVPNTLGLNTQAVGLNVDDRGFITVDDCCATNLPNVWAVGDCVRGPMLAHKASDEGILVAERIAGQKPHLDFNTIPWVIYTNPEVAWVGVTEQYLQANAIKYKKGQATFMSNGRALGLGNTIGFVKILSCAITDRILGVHMIGPFVSELISEAVVAMEFKASSEDLARIIHAHPSLAETLHEAALACDTRAIHS